MDRWKLGAVLLVMMMLLTSCRTQPPAEAGPLPAPATVALTAQDASQTIEIPADLALVVSRHSNSEGGSLHLVGATTGMDVPGQEPIPLGANYWHALSGSGRTLAVVSYPDPNTSRGGMLHFIDLDVLSD